MKISLNWLKDYIDLPSDLSVDRLTHDLTMTTVEVEGTEIMAEKFANIVVGRINEILPHPNADKLKICRTDIGDGELKDIVCGGINVAVGLKVAVSKPGAFVRWHGEGDLVEIKNAKLRGVDSYGMICASSEIGLFDIFPFEEKSTILDLSAFDAKPGTELHIALGIDDVILEIDNKSLTNRPDLWGHYGIARELSALYDIPLKKLPEFSEPEQKGGPRVSIDDPERCGRYVGVKIEGLSVKESRFAMKSRIWLVGMRPINAIVDITNYIMLTVGQPTHAFDFNNVQGGITVRRARQGEKLSLLNGRDLTLTTEDLVIADDREAVALAGVMGGDKDSILGTTTSVILEIANFDPLGTRKTAQRYELRTEASTRYEKGIDPDRIDQALALTDALFRSEFPQASFTGFTDNYPRKLPKKEIAVSLKWLTNRIGKLLSNSEIENLLTRLGFGVAIEDDKLTVDVPSWRRTGDISIPDDIMEEIARLYGYENFEEKPITTSFTHAINQRQADMERALKEYLSFTCGMQEVFTYPWVKDEYLDPIAPDRAGMLEISTPPAPDERYIRSTLIPNLLEAVNVNLRYYDDFAIYELTQVFKADNFKTSYDKRERLPEQTKELVGVLVAKTDDYAALYRRAKGIVESMSRDLHMEPFELTQDERPSWADETIWLNIKSGEKIIGQLALLSKKTALAVGIRHNALMIFQLDVDALTPLASRDNKYTHLPEFPQVEYDISLFFDETIGWQEIKALILGKKGPDNIVEGVDFVDEYRGKQVPAGKKSITMRLTLGSDKKTLTSEEIENAAALITKRLTKNFGAQVRGVNGQE